MNIKKLKLFYIYLITLKILTLYHLRLMGQLCLIKNYIYFLYHKTLISNYS
jgi:hypothetical protein